MKSSQAIYSFNVELGKVSEMCDTVSIIKVDVMSVCVHMVYLYREMSFALAWILWGTVGRPTTSNMVADD